LEKYLNKLRFILDNGLDRSNRTDIGTKSVFGMQMRFNMRDGFPAVTTKRLAFKTITSELLWFISGSREKTPLTPLNDSSRICKIWDANFNDREWQNNPNRDKNFDDLGRVYGVQWRHWKNSEGKEFDQLANAIDMIKNKPDSRRIIVSAWNPGELNQMALPPCHMFFQFFVDNNNLSLQMYQRSCDMFLGVPFNIASYSLLLHMVAQVTDLNAFEFIHTLGDAHIYTNHIKQVKDQLARKPLPLPQLKLNPNIKNIDDFKIDDIELKNYEYHPAIKAPMAV